MNRKSTRTFLTALVLLGLFSSGIIMLKRAAYEKTNRTVEIVVDLPAMLSVSPPEISEDEIIGRLLEIGATAAGAYELKGADLIRNNEILLTKISPSSGALASRKEQKGIRSGLRVIFSSPAVREKGVAYLNAYFGPESCIPGSNHCNIPDVGKAMEDVSLGLGEFSSGAAVCPRFFNSPYENETSIKLKIASIESLTRPAVIVFDGNSVLGFPSLIKNTADAIKELDQVYFGMVEIIPQDGASALARHIPDRVIPVHSISAEELLTLTPRSAVDRFSRAVRERGIRVLYVRPYTTLQGKTPQETLKFNLDYIGAIAESVKKSGYETGAAQPIGTFKVPRILKALCLSGAVALVGMLAETVIGFPIAAAAAGAVLALFLGTILPAGLLRIFVKLTALAVACTVPAFSAAMFFLPAGNTAPRTMQLPKNILLWISTCAVTMAGGSFIAAMLSERAYFLRLDVFSGVKLAFLIPLAIIFILYLKRTGMTLAEFLSSPLKYGELCLVMMMFGVVAIYLLRSGNEGPSAVGGFDNSFRSMLESAFAIRPRTKEFLIGHPALIAAGLFAPAKGRWLPLLLLLFGVIGQVSVLNTFCHIHTPILISWFRICVGIPTGLFMGICARAVLRFAAAKFGK